MDAAAELAVELANLDEARSADTVLPSSVRTGPALSARGLFRRHAGLRGAVAPRRLPARGLRQCTARQALASSPRPPVSQEHTIVDLGEDEFTVGRLHPMMDNDLRVKRIAAGGRRPGHRCCCCSTWCSATPATRTRPSELGASHRRGAGVRRGAGSSPGRRRRGRRHRRGPAGHGGQIEQLAAAGAEGLHQQRGSRAPRRPDRACAQPGGRAAARAGDCAGNAPGRHQRGAGVLQPPAWKTRAPPSCRWSGDRQPVAMRSWRGFWRGLNRKV
jgi:hypothetical protein